MARYSREECEYTKFVIEPREMITFSGNKNSKDITILIPITDDTPQCIKNRLNEVLWENMNNYFESLGYFDCMDNPCCCLLTARMEIIYDWELGVQYYLTFKVQETVGDLNVYFDSHVLISEVEPELHNEFASYCKYKLDKILFPIW